MPSRGVQDYEAYKKKREEERKKQKEKVRKWCQLAGLTLVELILCTVCFCIAWAMHLTTVWTLSIKFLILPVLPNVISAVYMVATCVDLISWISLRPITYLAWLTVSTTGIIMFLIYAGICLLSIHAITSMVGIALGIITALVFLADLVCCLLSLKRFPVPYWVLKRKFDKFDECVCTGDYDPDAEKEIERPICRCGETWGEPCTCDEEPTCGCGAQYMEEPPCPCCSCSTQALVEDQDGTTVYGSMFDSSRKSIVTTATGRDYLIEEDLEDPRKSRMTQVTLLPSAPPDVWCVTDPNPQPTASVPRKSMMSRMSSDARSGYEPRKSRMSQKMSMSAAPEDTRKSTFSRKLDSQTRKSMMSQKTGFSSSALPTYSVYTTKVDHNVPTNAFDFQPSNLKSFNFEKERKTSKHTSFKINSQKSLNFSGDGPSVHHYEPRSSDDDYAEGDFTRICPIHNKHFKKSMRCNKANKSKLKYSTYTSTDYLHGFMSDSELASHSRITVPSNENSLPGQVPSTFWAVRNVAASAKVRERRPTTYPNPSSRNTPSDRGENSKIIRNVSTTVRPFRTLSSVMETSQESKSRSQCDVHRRADAFPSECTITINK